MATFGPQFLRLCDEVVLLVWSHSEPVEGSTRLEGTFGEVISPLSCLKLGETEGGTRVVWAMKRPAEDEATYVAAAGGASSTPVDYARAALRPIEASFFDGLQPKAKLSLVSAMLTAWASLFKLGRSSSFAATLKSLLKVPEGASGQLRPLLAAGEGVVLEAAVPQRFGALKSAHLVAARHVMALKLQPMAVMDADRAQGLRRFFCALPAGEETLLVVLRGESGFLVREWRLAERPQTPERWWTRSGKRDGRLRQEAIDLFNAGSPVSRAASLEFQLRCPLEAKAVTGSAVLPSGEIQLALAGEGGTLVGGWYRDPSGFLDGFDILGPDDTPHSLDAGRYEFAGRVAANGGAEITATGFIGFMPKVRGPLLQPRFLMRLKSGVRYLMTPGVQPLDWSEARAAALRAVSPQALTDHVIETCLAPALGELQKAAQARIGEARVVRIGTPTPEPLATIVVPLYKVLDFLPFQVAAFASDPQIAGRCEVIYVLDSPDQADVAEHLLTGLNLVYGLPITLAVMERNGGYAIANNRAAALARGSILALVNSDVIPVEAGWLGELAQRLADAQIGAVGPKLLFEDDSIQHAGLLFAQDHRGRWLNHHYYKGMPRHYRPAAEERLVPGVTGACIVMRRAYFEAVGGFTEDYVIGDYEDSDLCLKLRGMGKEIGYVPSAELYHLERRSMKQSADYMRGVASQYNSWLHEQRWGPAMGALMSGPFAPVVPAGGRRAA